ncbi:MAG: 4Fe-4S binding protein [Candidatus Helarchaeota archaeon]
MINKVKIKISKNNCDDPLECGLRCVKACPYKLLAYYQKRTPQEGQAPIGFKIVSAFKILCNACLKCQEACPRNAITIILPKN